MGFDIKSDIVFIATNTVVSSSIKKALNSRGLQYPVITATVAQVLDVAEQAIRDGAKVLVSRGGATGRIQSTFDVPLVDMRHSCMDVFLTYQNARELVQGDEQIGYIGYENICMAVQQFNMIIGRELFVIEQITHQNQTKEKIARIAERGLRVVCGGVTIAELAPEYGMKAVMGCIHRQSIENAIDEALHALKIDRLTREKYETVRSVLNNISEGVVSFDSNWEINQINPHARKMFGDMTLSSIGQSLRASGTVETLASGNHVRDSVLRVGDESLVISGQPIEVDGAVTGGVVTIQKEAEIEEMGRRIKNKLLGKGHVAKNSFADIIGTSKAIDEVKRKAARYASSDSSVMIFGDTGTGKELFAQSIHNSSARKNHPFVAINCAALPREILESELFGYVKGAFTGARSDGKMGIFEMASTGTVFLDEIGEVAIDVQAKLLRVLQEKEIQRIGDDKIIPIDVRVIAATNKNLLSEVKAGAFREDLYYRLCVLELYVPPLRERKSDIPLLAREYLEKRSGNVRLITEGALRLLQIPDWPGNVRQLNNIMERMQVLCEKNEIDEATVAAAMGEIESTPDSDGGIADAVANAEYTVIRAALDKHAGNRTLAASELGMSVTTLWRKMKKYSKA